MQNTKNVQKNEIKSFSSLMSVIKPQIIAFLFTAVVFIALAILLTYTDFDENRVPLVSLICTALSTLMAGFDTASNFGKKGLLWGIISGIIYMAILFVICILCGADFQFNSGKITMIGIAIAGGGIGGVLGVNRKSKS
ncbi:MAG TPA: TIGR04086 family membrane protein [Candidatus Fimicola cottocaccae]|nr:TIGR04086 family membrane protein [Candidatus Fimicola cottocaccae]